MDKREPISLAVPFQLHLIAWPYVVFGIIEFTHRLAMLIAGTASNTWIVESAWIFLVACTGFGLLRLRFNCWVVAKFVAVILLGFSLIFVIYVLMSLVALPIMSDMPRTIRSNSSVGISRLLIGLTLSAASAAWAYWQYRVLNSAPIELLFHKAARAPVRRRWQWNVSIILLITLLVAATTARLISSPNLEKVHYENALIVIGMDEDRFLRFVERRNFLTNKASIQLMLYSKKWKDDNGDPDFIFEATSRFDDYSFSRNVHLLEIRDGVLKTSRRSVNESELMDWTMTNPDEFTIQSLLAFVDDLKNKPD